MAKIRVTKLFDFEMAHALHNYDGLCKNIHGHSYKLEVTLIGEPINDIKNPKNGMVIDFGDLKKTVNRFIVHRFDHSVVLSENTPQEDARRIQSLFDRIEIVDYQPTCENLLFHFVEILKKHLPPNARLFNMKLHETATSFAEWYESDN